MDRAPRWLRPSASPNCPAWGRSGSGTFMGTSMAPGLLGLDAECKGGPSALGDASMNFEQHWALMKILNSYLNSVQVEY